MRRMKKFLALGAAVTMLFSSSMLASAAEVRDIFDATYYMKMNPDIVTSVGTDETALYNHFITTGIAEGRTGSIMFDVVEYKKKYPDLVAVLGNSNMAYYQHFAANGLAEGRDGCGLFDPLAYAEAYPDIKGVYGTNVKALNNHFITKGLEEGRTKGLKFNYICYAALNPDLAKQYKNNEAALFKQYLNGGRAEGRLGAKPSAVYRSMVCDKVGEHNVTDWKVTIKVTCTEPGFEEGICNICGDTIVNKSPRLEYDQPHVDYNEDFKCEICGARNTSGIYKITFYN